MVRLLEDRLGRERGLLPRQPNNRNDGLSGCVRIVFNEDEIVIAAAIRERIGVETFASVRHLQPTLAEPAGLGDAWPVSIAEAHSPLRVAVARPAQGLTTEARQGPTCIGRNDAAARQACPARRRGC